MGVRFLYLKALTYSSDIKAGYFPDRSKHSLEIQYSLKNREMTEIFTPEKAYYLVWKHIWHKDAALKKELEDYEKKRWVHIGQAIGMSAGGCKKRAQEMRYVKKAWNYIVSGRWFGK